MLKNPGKPIIRHPDGTRSKHESSGPVHSINLHRADFVGRWDAACDRQGSRVEQRTRPAKAAEAGQRRRRRKSEASIRRAGGSPGWSATSRARVERSRSTKVAVERAITSAVERERGECQRKLEQGRARLRHITAAWASTGQSLGKVKGLLEETEREWLTWRRGCGAAFPGKFPA
jgi:hypothetical protein